MVLGSISQQGRFTLYRNEDLVKQHLYRNLFLQGARGMALYAAIAQRNGLVPIIGK
jgi:hypothetical protein